MNYTINDIAVLPSIIGQTLGSTDDWVVCYNDLINTHAIEDGSIPIDDVIQELIGQHLCFQINQSLWSSSEARKLIYETPLKEMPLHIYEEAPNNIIAAWRLQIEK
jgi:hypothetical protein